MPDRFLQPEPLVRLIEAERPTVAGAVPTIWNGLLQHIRAHGGDVSSLRLVPCGGSAVPHALMEAFDKELGVEILHAWGMTETSPLGSVARPPRGVTGDDAWKYRDTQGRLFCTVEGRLVGDEGTVLPNDGTAVGEVEVRGPWITGSYYKDDDPGKFHDGWLRTGDVGTIDRLGYVTLTDRAKDVIKSGGEWISSMELENCLMAHPAVAEAAAVAAPDAERGSVVRAVVVLREGHTASDELKRQLQEHVKHETAPYKYPRIIDFAPELPKTASGKIRRVALRAAQSSPYAPDRGQPPEALS
jgi:fatty-acyl-CoA synthase